MWIPSVVAFMPNGDICVGEDAVEYSFVEPARCARCFKLKLASAESVLGNGDQKTARECTTALLRAIKERAELELNCVITDVVLTDPVKSDDAQKAGLIGAATDAGLNVRRLVTEPAAGAVAFGLTGVTDSRVVLVIDIGGGTTDISVVRIERGRVEVLATDGANPLGGSDIDRRLQDAVLDAVESRTGSRPTMADSPLLFGHVDQQIGNSKVSLSAGRESTIAVAHDGHQIAVRFTPDQFHTMTDPLLQRVKDLVDSTVAAAGLKLTDINDFLLIGAPTRDRYIQDELAKHVGLTPRGEVSPDTAVAHGAAKIAADEAQQSGRASSLGHRTIPPQSVFVRECTPYDVGCAVLDRGDGQLRNSVIVPKNTPIPATKVDEFYLEREDQTTATIEVLQGESNALRDECLVIGVLKLEELPPEPTRTQRIRVEYAIDRNGMVHVTATDRVSGKTATASIDWQNGAASASTDSNAV